MTVSGAVDCWGYDVSGQAADQAGPFTALTAGDVHTCGLTVSGAADCWGDNSIGQADDQAGPFTALTAGGDHTCGLTVSGAADCWGENLYGQAADQAGPFTALTAGAYHTCGLTVSGVVHCWGDNGSGQAADQAGPFGRGALTAGYAHTCGLLVSGAVDCWGNNGNGQAADHAGPFIALTAGAYHTCGLTVSGAVDCWGYDGYGQAADQAGPFTALTAGAYHACGVLVSGAVDCWGYSFSGQAADQAGPFTALTAGDAHTCGLLVSGAVDCWGDNDYGQAADQAGPFTALTAGLFHSCGLLVSGAVDCWGSNSDGQAADQAGPFTALTAGLFHSCGLLVSGTVDCWGYDGFGQVGGVPVVSGAPPAGQSTVAYAFTFTVAPGDVQSSVSLVTGSLPPGLSLASTGVLSGTPTTAGTFTFSVTATGPLGVSAAWEVSITVAPNVTAAVVVAPVVSRSYGADNPPLTATYTGMLPGDTPDASAVCTTTATASSPVGSYPVTCDGAADPSYTFGAETGSLEVTRAAASVVAPAVSRPYGAPNPALTATYTGLLPGDTVDTPASCSTTATASSPVGSYPLTCDGAADANYTLTPATGSLTVTAATATTPTVVVRSSKNPTQVGQPVTYTATLTPVGQPVVPLTGKIVFYDGTTPISACGGASGRTITGTTATCTITYTTTGSHLITAKYLGASAAPASPRSPVLMQVLTRTSTELSASTVRVKNTKGRLTVTFQATLTSKVTAKALSGQTVFFLTLGPPGACAAKTNSRGVASCTVSVPASWSPSYAAIYAGSATTDPAVDIGPITR